MDRTERQLLCVKKWLQAGGRNTIVAATGFGKTRMAITLIEMLVKKKHDMDVLIVVPTVVLKEQWMNDYLIPRNLVKNCRVVVLKSAAKEETSCDLLVIDETHLVPTDCYSSIYTTVTYKYLLCMTATLERLDGKEELIKKYAPVCDIITLQEALKNGWISSVKHYCVLLKVPMDEYKTQDAKFNQAFAYFGFDFQLCMSLLTDTVKRARYAKSINEPLKVVTAMIMQWNRALRARKSFIMSHPHKIEVAKQIIEARKNKKIITFSSTIKDAESIGIGYVLHSKQSKKQNQEIIDKFNSAQQGVLNTSKAADAGVDVKGLSVGIILATDSSKIRATQRTGRIARAEPGKTAEMFTLVIAGTQDIRWFDNSATGEVIYITEDQLQDVLAGKPTKGIAHDQIANVKYRY